MLIALSVILTSWVDVRVDDTNRERACQQRLMDLMLWT